MMRKAPLLATWILERLGSGDDAFLGDLLEEYRRGRPRAWYWSQVFAGVALHSTTCVTRQPLRALRLMAAGWLFLLTLFFAFGNVTTIAILKRGFGWSAPINGGGGLEVWWPLEAAAAAVSILGFALIAIAIVRLNGGRWAWMLGPFLLSVAPAQMAVYAARSYLAERSATLFYVAPIGLPYERFWAPIVTLSMALAAGLVAARARRTIDGCMTSI